MKNKSKRKNTNVSSSLKNPAIIMAAIAIVMIILIIIFNIRNSINKKQNQSQNQQTNQVTSPFFDVDKNSAYAKNIDKYFVALANRDAETIVSLFYPHTNYTASNTETQLNSMYALYESQYGSNLQLSYKYLRAAKAEGTKYEELKAYIKEVYTPQNDVAEIYTFEIEFTKKGDIGSGSETLYLNMAKIGGKWYFV